MKKLAIEQKVFTTKEAAVIVFIVVALISLMGSISFRDFLLKVLVYGGISIVSVFLAAKFLSEIPNEDKNKTAK